MSDKIIIDIHGWVGENKIWQPHLIASEIVKNQDKEIVLTINDEGYDIVRNGLETLVKTICDHNNISYNQISFMSGNIHLKLAYFNHVYIGYNGDAARLKPNNNWIDPINSKYGLFLVRPTNERLYTFYNHLFWKNYDKGKATFHFFPKNANLKDSEFVDFLINHNAKWQFVQNNLPFSDYEKFNKKFNLITGDTNNTEFWNNVYKDCQIEIVCETNIKSNSFFITEKTLRPMLYGRLFMVIGSPSFENRLKSMGFDIFDDIIDKSYDMYYSYDRIDKVFLELDRFLAKDFKLLSIKERLINNQKKVNDFILNHYRTKIAKMKTSPTL
jgi:hypothetical protein